MQLLSWAFTYNACRLQIGKGFMRSCTTLDKSTKAGRDDGKRLLDDVDTMNEEHEDEHLFLCLVSPLSRTTVEVPPETSSIRSTRSSSTTSTSHAKLFTRLNFPDFCIGIDCGAAPRSPYPT
ncbi:hypothetical protein M0804_007972 [Polistes exclamans]|nr:hypothetical protein M0804_007972 [Polistes exclamans]